MGGFKMKAIRKENDNMVAYVKKRDVEILSSMPDMVDSRFFQEESIVNGIVDENGYYRITDKRNVRYLASLPFIPDYDDLVEMDCRELYALVQRNGMYSYEVNAIFIKDEALSQDDITFLRKLEPVNHDDLDALQNATTQSQQEYLRYCIRQQIRCYSYSIREMISHKEKAIKEEEERIKEEKKHRFVKALRRIGTNKK